MAGVNAITIEYTKLTNTENSFIRKPLQNNISVDALSFARYALYNRDKASTNFGIYDYEYLAYDGGFLTEADKLNTKNSNLEIKQNFTVDKTSTLNRSVNVAAQDGRRLNRVRNLKGVDSIADMASAVYDNDALAVKDFRKYLYQPGMISLWNGTWADLKAKMPFWRLCAPPDAGRSHGGIFVPNLLAKFIPGATPTDIANSNYKTGDTGGVDGITITEEQMPRHTHLVDMTGADDVPGLVGTTTFAYGGGDITTSPQAGDSGCSYGSWNCGAGCSCRNQCRGTFCQGQCNQTREGNPAGAASSASYISSVYIEEPKFTTRTIGYTPYPATITDQGEDDIGGSNFHENRPRYYTLCYIIYVGVRR
jgi:microcystin-dependent protein